MGGMRKPGFVVIAYMDAMTDIGFGEPAGGRLQPELPLLLRATGWDTANPPPKCVVSF